MAAHAQGFAMKTVLAPFAAEHEAGEESVVGEVDAREDHLRKIGDDDV